MNRDNYGGYTRYIRRIYTLRAPGPRFNPLFIRQLAFCMVSQAGSGRRALAAFYPRSTLSASFSSLGEQSILVSVSSLSGGKHEFIKFKYYAEQRRFINPNVIWTVRSLKRLFEFFRVAENSELRIDAKQLIECLTYLKRHQTPAWQRHQIAVAYARYQEMLNSKVDEQIQWVVTKLANLAISQRHGDGSAAQHEQHYQPMSRNR